ncbi:MAG: glycosyl hydrolase 115 family protein [Lacunisphaera sp.]
MNGASLLTEHAGASDFVLAAETGAAPMVVESGTDRAVVRAAEDLAADIERVTDRKPVVVHDATKLSGEVVIVGVVGHSPLIDDLVARGKLDVVGVKGSWETYVLQVVESPFPHVRRALVVVGSDRRGAIYGLYEISAAIGVSPWYWWADVAPVKRSELVIAAGTHRFGPPSVKYRGIFINDEDWGLHPWAGKIFEPEHGGIGPKTYAKIFELLLRLKANTLWPAMHAVSKPFNSFPEDAALANDYGIVMGSSHAEPMLRDNVGEWTAPKKDYDYVTNRTGVLNYWEERVVANGAYENIYTLGMRGIHDSGMQGPTTDAARIATLEKIFADQRHLLAKRVNPDVDKIPQLFCAYKEVLPLYRGGLRVPDDVTVMFPDDNFGYIRDYPTASERSRSGGFGIYYHLSYLGAPMSYLWLSTIPPALIWEEMHKAYEHGADRIWIANVGDLKPAEISTEFFLQLAWNIDRWTPETLNQFLPEWAEREFGKEHAAEIASLLAEYYVLNFQRKPEQLQWWLPRETRRPSALTDGEVQVRLEAFADLRARATALRKKIPKELQDAFFELAYYPIEGSALANVRFFEGERGHLKVARVADALLTEETRFFNETLARGKWRGIMALEPADDQWASMRIARWKPPEAPRAAVASPVPTTFIAFNAAEFSGNAARHGAAWSVIPGLGRTRNAVSVLPTNSAPVAFADVAAAAPRLDYVVTFPTGGKFTLLVNFLPTHPINGDALRVAVALDDGPPQIVAYPFVDNSSSWARGVLDEVCTATTNLVVPIGGAHTLHVYGIDAGVVLDKIIIDLGGLTPSYLGPVPVKGNAVPR